MIRKVMRTEVEEIADIYNVNAGKQFKDNVQIYLSISLFDCFEFQVRIKKFHRNRNVNIASEGCTFIKDLYFAFMAISHRGCPIKLIAYFI